MKITFLIDYPKLPKESQSGKWSNLSSIISFLKIGCVSVSKVTKISIIILLRLIKPKRTFAILLILKQKI